MRTSEKCRSNNNSDNPLTSRRSDGGKNKDWSIGDRTIALLYFQDTFITVLYLDRDDLSAVHYAEVYLQSTDTLGDVKIHQKKPFE